MPSWMRAPARVVHADDGAPTLRAASSTWQILLACISPSEPAHDREVLRVGEDDAAVDLAVAADDAVGRLVLLRHVEVGAAVGDEGIHLDEGARVKEQPEPLAGGQLSAGVLLFDRLGVALVDRCFAGNKVFDLIHFGSIPS